MRFSSSSSCSMFRPSLLAWSGSGCTSKKKAVGASFGGLRHGGYESRLPRCRLRRDAAPNGCSPYHGQGDAQHVRNIAEIDDEVVVAVNIAALGEPYLRSARIAGLFVG